MTKEKYNASIIVLAAGTGSRLRPLTESTAKCMVKLANKSILERQLEAYKEHNLPMYIVCGHKPETIDLKHYKRVLNPEYQQSNMVYSLFCLEQVFDGKSDIIISYGDIVYTKDIFEKLINIDHDVSVVADKNWEQLWKLRMDNVLADAETFEVEQDKLVSLGRKIEDNRLPHAQYIGLVKISARIASKIKILWNKLLKKDPTAKDMYFTDFLNLLINQGIIVKPMYIRGGWFELDTVTDFSVYEQEISKVNEVHGYKFE